MVACVAHPPYVALDGPAFLRRFYGPPHSLCTLFTATFSESNTCSDAGVVDGRDMDGRTGGVVGGHGRGRGFAGQIWPGQGGAFMIGMEMLYGFGAIVALVLLAYLIFALICAEEF